MVYLKSVFPIGFKLIGIRVIVVHWWIKKIGKQKVRAVVLCGKSTKNYVLTCEQLLFFCYNSAIFSKKPNTLCKYNSEDFLLQPSSAILHIF